MVGPRNIKILRAIHKRMPAVIMWHTFSGTHFLPSLHILARYKCTATLRRSWQADLGVVCVMGESRIVSLFGPFLVKNSLLLALKGHQVSKKCQEQRKKYWCYEWPKEIQHFQLSNLLQFATQVTTLATQFSSLVTGVAGHLAFQKSLRVRELSGGPRTKMSLE